jgi:hypothetical protein
MYRAVKILVSLNAENFWNKQYRQPTGCNNNDLLIIAGRLEAELPGYRPATSWVLYTTSCIHSLVFLKMGEMIARNKSS